MRWKPNGSTNLVFDPHETHNLAADPNCQDHLAELRQRLNQWMLNTDDPLAPRTPRSPTCDRSSQRSRRPLGLGSHTTQPANFWAFTHSEMRFLC